MKDEEKIPKINSNEIEDDLEQEEENENKGQTPGIIKCSAGNSVEGFIFQIVNLQQIW